MREIWIRIERWLATNAPRVLESLQPAATKEQILQLEEHIGTRLPAELRASLLIHDGQAEHADVGFVDAQELLSVRRIADESAVWKDLLDSGTFLDSKSSPDAGVRDDWWNPYWIPLTHDGGGNHFCADLDPAEGGTRGQIITMWHDDDERRILAPSFEAWLESIADDLEQNKIVFSDEGGGLVNSEDL